MSQVPEPTPAQRRQVWLIIFGAFCMVPVMLVAVALMQGQRPLETEPGAAKTVFYVIGALSAIAGAIAAKSFDPPEQGVVLRRSIINLQKFQTASIIALALSEFSALIGLVGKTSGNFELIDFLALAALSLIVNFLFILPRALAFWKTQIK